MKRSKRKAKRKATDLALAVLGRLMQVCIRCRAVKWPGCTGWRWKLCRNCREKVPNRFALMNPTKPCEKPTKFLPGTPEKIAVMAMRFANDEPIFHADDAKRQ